MLHILVASPLSSSTGRTLALLSLSLSPSLALSLCQTLSTRKQQEVSALFLFFSPFFVSKAKQHSGLGPKLKITFVFFSSNPSDEGMTSDGLINETTYTDPVVKTELMSVKVKEISLTLINM